MPTAFYSSVVYGRGRTKRRRKFDEMRAVFPFGREHTSGVRGASGRGPTVFSISLVEFVALDGGRNIKLVSCRGCKELAVCFFSLHASPVVDPSKLAAVNIQAQGMARMQKKLREKRESSELSPFRFSSIFVFLSDAGMPPLVHNTGIILRTLSRNEVETDFYKTQRLQKLYLMHNLVFFL